MSDLYLQSAILNNVRHAVSTRHLMRHPDERIELAQRLCDLMAWNGAAIALAEQVHGNAVTVVDSSNDSFLREQNIYQFPGADALVCNRPNIMLGIVTADCVPILFADTEAGVIGAVHAGWRGTYARILSIALEKAFAIGAEAQRIRLFIGPSVCGQCYEVSEELAQQFANEFPQWAGEFVHGRHVDLPALNMLQGREAGVPFDGISIANLCTIEQDDLCSYRRDGTQAGRMLSAILME